MEDVLGGDWEDFHRDDYPALKVQMAADVKTLRPDCGSLEMLRDDLKEQLKARSIQGIRSYAAILKDLADGCRKA